MLSQENIAKKELNDYGVCRCCMAQGWHQDVDKEYYYNNIREVYREIFDECFNLTLSTDKQISPLICSNCVQRLRDALSFRMMVVSTESQLLAAVSKDDKDTLFVDVPGQMHHEVKVEVLTEDNEEQDIFNDRLVPVTEDAKENESENDSIEHALEDSSDEDFDDDNDDDDDYVYDDDKDNDDDDNDDDEDNDNDEDNDDVIDSDDFTSDSDFSFASSIDDEPVVPIEGEKELLARFPKSMRPLPKRSDLSNVCPEFDQHLKKLEDKLVKPKSLQWFIKRPPRNRELSKYVSDKLALALNASTIFEHSNATAFKTKTKNGYPCFYCREIFNCDTLRDHQRKHPKSSIYKLLAKYSADVFIVYADITDLKCTICDKSINKLDELKTHLIEEHDQKMYVDHPDRVIPFKLTETDFECQVCGAKYVTFGAVERHMNTHFGNFTCEECGAGFITKRRLSVHTYCLHRHLAVTCNICKKSFQSSIKLKIHSDAVHKLVKKNKCPKCPEKFIDYFTRQKHLEDVHGEEPLLYKCKDCNRGFSRKYTLSSHVKRCHLVQKDIKCNLCSYKCYTKAELRVHLVKHNGKKQFECDICNKRYSRKSTLSLHIRIHNDDRRYTCDVCGTAFIQKRTLTVHMKTHVEQN